MLTEYHGAHSQEGEDHNNECKFHFELQRNSKWKLNQWFYINNNIESNQINEMLLLVLIYNYLNKVHRTIGTISIKFKQTKIPGFNAIKSSHKLLFTLELDCCGQM